MWTCLIPRFPACRSCPSFASGDSLRLGRLRQFDDAQAGVEIVRVARDAGWKTIVGGPEPGAYVREYLEAGLTSW